MAECLITRRGGETYKLPVLNASYPKDVTTTVIKGKTTSATFDVVISEPGNPAEYTYQWYVNGSAVSGATGSSYTKSDLSTTATYEVYCKVTNKKGTVDSRVATLKVTQYYTPVLNTSYPANATVVKGNSVTSKVTIATAGYPTSYTYQWYKNGTAVSGATSSTYTFTPTAVGTTTVYCKVTNSAGSVNSRTATITATGLYLYKNGDQCTAVTGGWSVTNQATVTQEATYMKVYAGTDKAGSAATKNKINLANYNTLVFKGYCNKNREKSILYVGDTSQSSFNYINKNAANIQIPQGTASVEVRLDISGITGSYNAGCGASESTVYCYEMYLE